MDANDLKRHARITREARRAAGSPGLLRRMIDRECDLLGFDLNPATRERIALAIGEQGIDWGEPHITCAVVGARAALEGIIAGDK